MNMTIFADASFCQSGAAGWGVWAKRDGWEKGKLFSGAFRQKMPDICTAEISALANGIYAALEDDITIVMLQSDSVDALRAVKSAVISRIKPAPGSTVDVRGEFTPRNEQDRAALEIIKTKLSGKIVELRHVKGHSRGGGRSWVNHQCDRLAREGMQLARSRE